jgi:hypothetical protein
MRPLPILLFSLTVLAGGYWFYAFAPLSNPAVEIGYYGYYHRIQRVIKTIPDVVIIKT